MQQEIQLRSLGTDYQLQLFYHLPNQPKIVRTPSMPTNKGLSLKQGTGNRGMETGNGNGMSGE